MKLNELSYGQLTSSRRKTNISPTPTPTLQTKKEIKLNIKFPPITVSRHTIGSLKTWM